jgi:hypothetical protein
MISIYRARMNQHTHTWTLSFLLDLEILILVLGLSIYNMFWKLWGLGGGGGYHGTSMGHPEPSRMDDM